MQKVVDVFKMTEKIEMEQNRSIKYLDRGMTVDEVNTLITAPMPDRERAYFRGLYETFYRANELLLCEIEDYNKKTGELVARHTKNKYNPKNKQYIKSPPKHMILSKTTQALFRKVIGNRKKGAIFINKKGKRLTKTFFQIYINELATRLGIQQITHITPTGKEYHLVCLKALREAGERHCDISGADSEVTARGSQHSALVKERYYKKTGWEEIQNQVRRFHPAFKE
jgi:integrase